MSAQAGRDVDPHVPRPEWVEAGVAALVDTGCAESGSDFIRDNVYVDGAVTAVLPEVIRQAKTEAWDEGRTAGAGMGVGIGERIVGTRSDWPAVPKNPYRQEDES